MKYLNTYAYHTNLGLTVFLIPVLLTFLVSLLTVSWQADPRC